MFNARVYEEFEMTQAKVPQIHLRNSVSECAQSLKKENIGMFYNYGIRDCAASIAAMKVSWSRIDQ